MFSVAKKMTNGAMLQMDYDLTDVHPVIAWDGLGKEGPASARFHNERISRPDAWGVQHFDQRFFRALNSHDLLNSLTASFTNARKDADTVIPIAKIKLPVPQFPIVDLLLTLQLHCYAGGKIELLFKIRKAASVWK